MPRTLLSAPHGQQPLPDIANFCWAEHGLRLGLPRMARVLAERGIPVSAAMNAAIIERYPACAELVLNSGWDIIGHGVVQRSLARESDEAAIIARALEMVENFSGVRPRGWLGPGFGESAETPHLLREAGIDHLYDWMLDDVPCWINTRAGQMIAMPYALELNDVTIFAQERQSSSMFLQRYRDTIEMIEPELASYPRILTLGLHPHIMGVPHRLKYFAETLDMLKARPDTIFMTSTALADWFASENARDAPGVATKR
jgi:peptidoglycan/xylan/chitin deacetylase (PgdA/CDA1 family)